MFASAGSVGGRADRDPRRASEFWFGPMPLPSGAIVLVAFDKVSLTEAFIFKRRRCWGFVPEPAR